MDNWLCEPILTASSTRGCLAGGGGSFTPILVPTLLLSSRQPPVQTDGRQRAGGVSTQQSLFAGSELPTCESTPKIRPSLYRWSAGNPSAVQGCATEGMARMEDPVVPSRAVPQLLAWRDAPCLQLTQHGGGRVPCLGRAERDAFLYPDFKACCCIYRAQPPWQPRAGGSSCLLQLHWALAALLAVPVSSPPWHASLFLQPAAPNPFVSTHLDVSQHPQARSAPL